ncbi:MAG: YceI family protein [Chloroflexi bacterium]|nr:YceI family protein [Chloroflexota bacterium]
MQNKTTLFLGVALLAVVVVGGGWWAYDFVQGDTAAPSGPITAIPIAVNTVPAPTEAPIQVNQPAPSEAQATAIPTSAPVEPIATTAVAAISESGLVIFQISQAESEASFSIFEELNGQPKTVVGATDQVAGQVALDMNDLTKTQVGVIQVNARALVTDNDRRNRAIRNFILQTDQYEFITFTPTAITGLNGPAQPGQPFTFQIAGDLTIRNVTQPAVFEVTVQGESATRLTGTATTVVRRSDYKLTIPSVPNVANVGEEVTIEIDIVAEAASS